jgi:hypothetical protein
MDTSISKGRKICGWVLTTLVVLFLIFDGVTKVMKNAYVMAASAKMGLSANAVVGIGVVLLLCTAIYVIPRTAVFGAVLLTGYLGGAVAAQVLTKSPPFELAFPIIFAVLAWGGLCLRRPGVLEGLF